MNISGLTNSLQKIPTTLYRYRLVLFVVGFVGCYIVMITQISSLTQKEPNAQSSTAAKKLIIDSESIEKIQDLEDQNVEVRALFNEARKNPFSE